MPADTEELTLTYQYERYHTCGIPGDRGSFTARKETNIIDLGLIAPDGQQVGASGSDKPTFLVSETHATPGYRPCPLVPGQWQILVGAYKVAKAGVNVVYELTFTPKHLRLLKGDLHTHTVASDGVLTVEELAQHALRQGLDFLAISDHNQIITRDELPKIPGITLIPGIEWTHYQGHASFLGVDQPYDEPFFTNTDEEMQVRFKSARDRGAFISIDHPFEPGCEFRFNLQSIPFDCLEVWNGPMRESNLRAVGLWQSLLAAGNKLPICGGSDYHHNDPFIFVGGPTTCVYAMSASPADILNALKQGHAYIIFTPDGPSLELSAGDAILGESVPLAKIKELSIDAGGLRAGDVLQVVTGSGSVPILKAEKDGKWQGTYVLDSPGFARIEILRSFLPGLPLLPALISNPIYFDKD